MKSKKKQSNCKEYKLEIRRNKQTKQGFVGDMFQLKGCTYTITAINKDTIEAAYVYDGDTYEVERFNFTRQEMRKARLL